MPNRIIKESICTSYDIDNLSMFAEVTFYRMLTFADDFGRFQADPNVILGGIYPLRLSQIDLREFKQCLNELSGNGLILFYVGDNGKPYGIFPSWDNHQSRRAKHSKHPDPPKEDNKYHTTIEELIEACESNRKNMKSYASTCNQVKAYVPEESRNRGAEDTRKDVNANDFNKDNKGNDFEYDPKFPNKVNPSNPPGLDKVKEIGNAKGITPKECEYFYNRMEEIGWVEWLKGSEQYNLIYNWHAKLARWKQSGYLRTEQDVNENKTKHTKVEVD